MDYLRVLLVPFRPAGLLTVAVFALAISFFLAAASFFQITALWSLIAVLLLNTWILKYCYVLIERIADGVTEPPVMDMDMLSAFETRPVVQAALIGAGATLCYKVGGEAGWWLAGGMALVFPASAALLGMGDNAFQAINPIAWFRVVRGLGPMYLVLLCALALAGGICWLMWQWQPPTLVSVTAFLLCEIGFFGMIGGSIWLRRKALGFEPRNSPERAEARAEAERVKERARMLDDVFQQVRIGKHVDATVPLARWMRDVDGSLAVRDALHVAEKALSWNLTPALNPIGSTLIRHLLRFGRPDAALSVFELFRRRSPQFTMDSATDLRILAEYAESVGKLDLAQSMRLETPVHRSM